MTELWIWQATLMLPAGNVTVTVIAPDQWAARQLIDAQYGSGKIMGSYVHCVARANANLAV
tara:strand:+ start:1046 stop:1228 length:183 start_codon:yes stop_codon:yes gene_type:complete